MDMSFIIIIVVVSVIGSIAWWAFMAFVAFKAAQAFSQHFEMQARQIMQLAGQVNSMPPDQRAAAQAQLAMLFNSVSTQRPQLSHLAQQRYDLRMAELGSVAASVGMKWP